MRLKKITFTITINQAKVISMAIKNFTPERFGEEPFFIQNEFETDQLINEVNDFAATLDEEIQDLEIFNLEN